MPTRVLFLRHAETTHPHVFNGFESDVPLSPRGERQARAIAPVLAAYQPTVIVSSGMVRARQTAAPIAEACGVSIRVEPELHERKVGKLCGLTDVESGGLWKETMRRWMDGDPDYTTEGAESFNDMKRRLLPVWQRLADDYAGQTYVVVGHGMVKRVLLLSLLPGWTLADWARLNPTHNTGVCELLHVEGVWQDVRLNELHEEVRKVNEDPSA